jgi:hypothetical protein
MAKSLGALSKSFEISDKWLLDSTQDSNPTLSAKYLL